MVWDQEAADSNPLAPIWAPDDKRCLGVPKSFLDRDLIGQYPGLDRGQEGDHRRMTFEEEYIALMKAHGIAYDLRFTWG